MQSLEAIMRVGYTAMVVSILIMIWISLAGGVIQRIEPVRYPPCYFNPLCSCSKAVPDLGIVQCRDVPLPRIPPPLNNSKVFMLHLDNNGLHNIDSYFLQSTGLYRLEISNNPLMEIPDNAFIGLERSLWELELKNNDLIRVPSRAIRHLQKLRLLDLTGNDIIQVGSGSWRGLGNSLETLILAENAISVLPPDAFGGLPMLETIDLRGNNLKEIDPTVFREGMGRLSKVILADNLLSVVPYEALAPLKSLKFLDLTLNRISTMDVVPEYLNINKTIKIQVQLSLDTLRLDHNQITQLETLSFQYFGILNKTYLNDNPLQVIEDDAFRPAKIRELSLHNCHLAQISPAAFGGLEGYLQILDLSGNNLTALPHNLFSNFDNLRSLSLRENSIKGLKPDEAFNGFQYSLYQLDLGGNLNAPVILQDLRKMRNLRSLTISKMPKSQLDPEDFQDFGFELEDLQIVSGNLKTIKDHVFKHVRGIKKLDFSENRIDKIEDDAFVEIGHTLTTLKISHGLSTTMVKLPANALRPLTNLQLLDLSNNKIRSVSDTSFHFLKKIKKLELQDNEITELLKGTFQGDIHSALEEIILSFNIIKLVQQHTFVDLPLVEIIHLDDNQIERLERRAFMNLNRLKTLNLRGNKIATIADEAFQNLPELDYLDIAYNALKTFDFTMFDQVGTLALLKVNASHNKVKDLVLDVSAYNMGRDTGTGGFHSNIKVLDLSHNNISHISRSFFRPAELSLTHLYLGYNSLVNATWDVFGNMPHLQWLDLSSNKLSEISFDVFRNTKKLQVLLAANNELETFHAETFRVLSGLRVVDLSNNKIRMLPDGLFFGEGLEKLDLSHNDLSRMPLSSLSYGSASTLCDFDVSHNDIAAIPNGDIFARFKSLRTLDLSYNRLLQIDEGTFSALTTLVKLELSHNVEMILEPDGKSFSGIDDTLIELALNNVSRTTFRQLPFSNLRTLSLSHNTLPSISLEMAVNMSTLRELNLAHNDLTAIPLVVNHLPRLRSLNLAGNPITSITNASLIGIADHLESLDITDFALMHIEEDAISELEVLRSLKMSSYKNLPDFNIPSLIEGNIALRNLELKIDYETSMSGELAGVFPTKVRNIGFTGKGLHLISNTALQGLRSPMLHITFKNTSVTVLQRELFKNLGTVKNVSVDIRDNEFKSLGNPSTGNQPDLPRKTFLTHLKISNNRWTCNCDMGWVEVWLRKRRQYVCKEEEDSYMNLDTCRHADDDLRVAKCNNKNNNSLLEVLKTDIECGWSSSAIFKPFAIYIITIFTILIMNF